MTYAWLATHWMGKKEGDGQNVPVWKTMTAGFIAASVGPLTNCPMDVAKTRLMAQIVLPGMVPKYKGLWGTMNTVYKEEGAMGEHSTVSCWCFPGFVPGISAFVFHARCSTMILTRCVHVHPCAALWKGLTPRLARVAPGQAIMWSVVSQVVSFFEQRQLAEMAHKF